MTMPIKRSQSAPQPIETLFTTPKARAGASTCLPRSKSYLVERSVSPPWVEREDPFSLGGFFPASHGAAREEEQWKWLRKEEDEDTSRDGKESVFVDNNDSVIGQLDDKLAEETIKNEDKFGVLSLGMFAASDAQAES